MEQEKNTAIVRKQIVFKHGSYYLQEQKWIKVVKTIKNEPNTMNRFVVLC